MLNEIASRALLGNGVMTGFSRVQLARQQPRPWATRSKLSLNGLIKSPAPDENIDRTYRLPVGVVISRYDDFVEIVLQRLDNSAVPGITDRQLISTSRTTAFKQTRDDDDIVTPQHHTLSHAIDCLYLAVT
jgi:hypothetical protein